LGVLEVIVDPSHNALQPYAEELGTRVTGDLDDIFSGGVDAVVVAAPAADHAILVRRVLEANIPVFVEKPLALEVAEAEALAQLAADRGLTLMVGHLLQYHPAFIKLKEMVNAGAIGDLRHVTSNRLNPGAIRTEENALWSMAPHDFSMVLGLVESSPINVSAQSVNIVNRDIPDQYFVNLRFSESVTAHVNVSWLSPYKEHKLTVLGTRGALVFEDTSPHPDRKLVIYRDYVDTSPGGPRFVKQEGEPVAFPANEPLEAEMRTFLDCIQGLGSTRTGPAEAIPVLRLLQAAERASAEFT
jgi:UDP-2-acetamido-3-amino-2,3-dideoxy-glucuronate N-acetyltransferase